MIGRGPSQYVILGAGLDSFAQRRPEIASRLRVFEVDKPAPQEWKRQRLIELGFGVPDWLRFVPVDFEAGGSWRDALMTDGFDESKPAIVVSTGVSMYLTKEANAATLREVAALAQGSTLAMTFLLPLELADPEVRPGLEMAEKGARASGTPFLSFFTPPEILALLHENGFREARSRLGSRSYPALPWPDRWSAPAEQRGGNCWCAHNRLRCRRRYDVTEHCAKTRTFRAWTPLPCELPGRRLPAHRDRTPCSVRLGSARPTRVRRRNGLVCAPTDIGAAGDSRERDLSGRNTMLQQCSILRRKIIAGQFNLGSRQIGGLRCWPRDHRCETAAIEEACGRLDESAREKTCKMYATCQNRLLRPQSDDLSMPHAYPD